MPGSQGSGWAGTAGVGGVEAPVQDGGDVDGGRDLAAGQGGGERLDRVSAVGAEEGEVAEQGGPGGAVTYAGDDLVDALLQGLQPAGFLEGDGGVSEAVAVPGVCGRQGGGDVGGLVAGGGGGDLRFVAGQDLLEDVDRGAGVGGGGGDDGVLVAVHGGDEVQVVGVPAAGEGDVQLLTGLLAGGHGVQVSAVTPWAPWTVVAYPSWTWALT